MKKIFIIMPFVLFSTLIAQSQNFTVTGKVLDADTKKPLEYASITFMPKNSQNAIGCITTKKGKFEAYVPKGKYTIVVEYLGYKTITFKSQNILNNQHYGSIELSEDPEIIDDVEIIAERKNIEFSAKKITYNVSKDVAAEGAAVSDVINNIPSVSFNDGQVKIRGVEAAVMINGKMSSLSKEEVLRSLPTGTVEKIEVNTSPGAQYNAEYKAILNIVTKKNKKSKNNDLNASITGSGGFSDIYGGLVTLNSSTEKVNFYTNVSYSHKNNIRISDIKSEYFTGGITSSFLNESSEYNSHNSNFISTIGVDYYLSKNTTLSGVVNYSDFDTESETATNTSFLDAAHIETASNNRDHSRLFDDEAFELTAEIEHKFTKKGRKLTSYIKYLSNLESENTRVTNSNSSFTDEFFTRKNNLNNTVFDIKYKTPVKDKTTLTIGYKGDFDKIYFGNSGIVTKSIDYFQDLHAVFADYEYETDKFYFGIGVREEFITTTVNYLDLNTSQNRQFNNIFPSIYTQYTISDSKSITLSHSRHIQRPDYTRIQPFEEKFSETSSYIGNELLKPVFFDVTSLSYSYYGNKITLIPSLYFQKWNDYWQDVTYKTGEIINGVNKLITTPQNVGWANIYGIDFTAMYRVSNALNFTFNTNLYNFDQHGIFETTNILNQPVVVDFNKKSFNGEFKLTTQIKLPHDINFQTNVFHYLKSEGAVSMRRAYTYASLSMNKKVLKKKGTLSLNINDVFNSKQTDRDRFGADYFSNSLIKNRYPDIILSFTYRFNKSKSNKKINFKGKDKKPNY